MKKNLLIISSLFFLSIVITCCKKDKTQEPEIPELPQPQLKTDSTSLNLKGIAGSRDSFSVQSNVGWAISINPASAASWLKVSVTSGSGNAKIYVTTEVTNSGTAAQSAAIVISPVNADAPSLNIPVTQRTFQVNKVWSKLYGDGAEDFFNAVTPTDDGGFVAVGYSYGNPGQADYWIVKINGNGDKVWSKLYGGSGFDQPSAVIRTTDGGYVVAGYSSSIDGDVVGGHGFGSYDVWVIKIDANGNKLWAKTYGGSGHDFAGDVIATPDGGYLIVGGAGSTDGDISGNLGNSDMWAIRLDANGNKLWAKNFGGSLSEAANAVAADANGGFILAGSSIDNYGNSDAVVVKLDASGNKQWTKTLGGSGYDFVNDITVAADGGYLVVGAAGSNDGDFSTNKGSYDVWAIKLDVNGNKVWSKTYGGSLRDHGMNVIKTADNGFLVAGFTQSKDGDIDRNAGSDDMFILKLNADGVKMWTKTFGGDSGDQGFAMCAASESDFILAGRTFSNNGDVNGNHGQSDAWLLKITE